MKQTNFSNQTSGVAERLVEYLRHSPASRSVLYLTTNAALLELGSRLRNHQHPFSGEWMHIALVPLVAAITAGFVRLEPTERVQGHSSSRSSSIGSRLAEFAAGAALGAGALAASLGVARMQDWISAPAWGWEKNSGRDLLTTTVFIAASHLAVAYNEETVFRGYGYTTLAQAMPPEAAGTTLTLLFGLAHKLDPQVFLGEVALGAPLLLLRLHTGRTAMSIGYHWAWNVVQTAVFAATNERPVLRPLQVHGPYLWVGRPGFPEPGLLSVLVQSVVASALGIALARRRSRQTQQR